MHTVEIHRLGQGILDWTTAVAGKADKCQLSDSFTCHSSGPIKDSLVQCMNFYGIIWNFQNIQILLSIWGTK